MPGLKVCVSPLPGLISPFVNTILVFCANLCFLKFNIPNLKKEYAVYSLIYLKVYIKCRPFLIQAI